MLESGSVGTLITTGGSIIIQCEVLPRQVSAELKNKIFKLYMIFTWEQQWVCLYRLQIPYISKEGSLWEEGNRCSFPSSMVVECQSKGNFVLSKTEIMPGELISLQETLNKVVVPEGTGRWMSLPNEILESAHLFSPAKSFFRKPDVGCHISPRKSGISSCILSLINKRI